MEKKIKTLSVRELLATALGQRDEKANIELAEKIVAAEDAAAVDELVKIVQKKNKDLRHDAIKALYETGYRSAKLITPHLDVFVKLLGDKSNRMQWGAFTAVAAITPLAAKKVYQLLPQLSEAAEKGSVISKDQYMMVLIALYSDKKFSSETFPLIREHLLKSAAMQFPMYAERFSNVLLPADTKAFTTILKNRMTDLAKESQKKRVEKILRKLEK